MEEKIYAFPPFFELCLIFLRQIPVLTSVVVVPPNITEACLLYVLISWSFKIFLLSRLEKSFILR